MATRRVKDGESDLPRDVFELDKDERWQARLDEARARREIALAEKAAGHPPKKRLKPWETEDVVPNKPIDPVIQERDTDRVDFADRVEAIRQVTSKDAPEPAPAIETKRERSHNWARLVEPNFPPPPDSEPEPNGKVTQPEPAIEAYRPPTPDEFDNILTTLARPRSAKKTVNLLLPDAPAVKELAERYAATLEPEFDDAPVVVAAPESEIEPVAAPARRKRPYIMASSAILLALLTFMSEALPVEKGPAMPPSVSFVFQPALGVTWSLQEVPIPTQSGEWVPRTVRSPGPPLQPTNDRPAEYASRVAPLKTPALGESFDGLAWSQVAPVRLGDGPSLFVPQLDAGHGTQVVELPGILNGGFDRTGVVLDQPRAEKLPDFGNAPTKTRPPRVRPAEPDSVPGESSLVPPARLPERPLKITILRPQQSDEAAAAMIADDVSRKGHELVRVQTVEHSISSRNIRYFHAADRSEAERLASEYDAELRDFTWFRPQPSEGTTEVWLTGRSVTVRNPVATARTRVQTPAALAPPEPQQVLPAPTPRIAEPRRSLFERIFLNHKRIGGRPNTGDGQARGSATRTGSNRVAEDGSGEGTGAVTGTDTGSTGGGEATSSTDTGTDTGTGGTDTGTGGTDTGTDTGTDSGDSGTDSGSSGTGGADSSTDTGSSDTGGDSGSAGSDTGSDSGGTDSGSGGDSDSSGGNGNGNGGAGNGNGNGNL